MNKSLTGAIAWLLGILLVNIAHAEHVLPAPEGQVVLKVSGNITHTNVGNEAHFDVGMLAGFPRHHFITGTPWTDQPVNFSGPLIRDLLAYLGADGKSVHAFALNGFEADIPVRDFDKYNVIMAFRRNGELMPIREYGPLWILYPFDCHKELFNEKYRSRAVWQVMKINVH